MTKQSNARTATVAQFDVNAWRDQLAKAAINERSSAKLVLELVLAARDLVEEDTVREAVQLAFAAALQAVDPNVTHDEAIKAKSVKNRVADAMAVFKADELPGSMPGHLQGAAAAVRKARKAASNDGADGADDTSKRGPSPRKVLELSPLEVLAIALEGLRGEAGEDAAILELVADMVDLADEIAGALKASKAKPAKGSREERKAKRQAQAQQLANAS